ncbi:hypothetical protein M9980_08205 [Sphingomonas donggukensis]|uniref:Transposase n=1 Tax=Sphingomonas donggukensis TaxID=2949093 RepID=A0ABY4TRV6_9SPHN|nr:hypothetical protein [Sphingomonas donggukensis]URW74560.1 hypothetical protein M9980_08205 [Sphingomonas donggukensis]
MPTLRPVREFEPVPRKYRHDGWTVERQRAFIAALAETGSVKAAAGRINMSPEGAYYLRRQPGAESFAAAWEVALDHGVQSLADIAIERAREGVPVPVFWKGEQVGEKRWYNDRLLMFILRHHLPRRYGALAALPTGTRHPDTIAREEAAAAQTEAAQTEADRAEADQAESDRINEVLLKRYEAKVRAERRLRLEGRVVAADFTLRQLTHIELILDAGGRTLALIDRATGMGPRGEPLGDEPYASEVSDLLATIREEAWAKEAAPPRPPVRRPRIQNGFGRDAYNDKARLAVQVAAAKRIAEAQAEWEAAGTAEGWKAWCEGRG